MSENGERRPPRRGPHGPGPRVAEKPKDFKKAMFRLIAFIKPYLALVIVDEPVGAYYGSVVAAPAAKEIFEGIIEVKDIEPYE